jgi:hypothetical protein
MTDSRMGPGKIQDESRPPWSAKKVKKCKNLMSIQTKSRNRNKRLVYPKRTGANIGTIWAIKLMM